MLLRPYYAGHGDQRRAAAGHIPCGGQLLDDIGRSRWLVERLSLEKLLGMGALLGASGIATLAMVFWQWTERDYGAIYTILPAVLGTTLITLGLQTGMAGFLLAILGGNIARFRDFPAEGR